MDGVSGMESLEATGLWAALSGLFLSTIVAVFAAALGKRPEKTLTWLLACSAIVYTVAIGLRWWRLGHVPVGTVYEMLSANVWGLSVALAIAYGLFARIRPAAVFALPLIVLLMGWMLMVPAGDSTLPGTYKTVWLFIHIGFIKLFLGCAFVALMLACAVLVRGRAPNWAALARMPNDASLIELTYRFLAIGWIFDTLGILSGAIWARDAWGLYWSWDKLEVWSLITWLSIAFAVHLRSSYRIGAQTAALMVVGVWLLAFFTFFGVPFVSTSLHKGMI